MNEKQLYINIDEYIKAIGLQASCTNSSATY